MDLLRAKLVEMRRELQKKISLGKIDDKGVITATENIQKLKKEIEDLEKPAETIGSKFKSMFKMPEASSFNEKWGWSLKGNIGAVGKLLTGSIHPGLKLAASILGGIFSLLGKILKTAWNIAKAVAKWAFQTAINALKKILSLVQKIASGIVKVSKDFGKNLVKNVQSIAKGMASVGKSIGQFAWKNSAVSRMTESIGKLRKVLSSFTRVAFYRVVRSAIKYITESFKEGAERAYFYAKEYGKATKYIAEALDELSSKEFQMQNQLGAAWSTLLATIQPVLIQIINMVTRAAEVLTQFFAILGGKTTYLKAKDYTHDWADETEKGAKAAKEWKNQLMDFDTLNRLNEPTDNSSGKTDKYKDYENMFEEMPIESWIQNLQNTKLPKIGEKIAEWLNGMLKKIDEWFIKSRPKWKKYAKELAGLLNGFIDKFDWAQLGKTVGDGLNAIFDAFNTFLTSVKWFELGRGIGTTINGLFETVEWDLIGETFANKWNALLRTIEGIVTTPGIWKNIGTGIGKMVRGWIDNIDILSLANSFVHVINGVTDMIGAFLDQNPFKELAPKISDALFLMVTAVRWDELGKNIGRFFQESLSTLFDIVRNFPFSQLGQNIAMFLDNLGNEINFGDFGRLLMDIGLGLWKTLYGSIQYLEATGGIGRFASRLSDFVIGALTELADWLESLDQRVIAGAIQQFIDNIDGTGIKDAFVRCIRAAWTLAVSVKEELFPNGLLPVVAAAISNWIASVDWVSVGATIRTSLSAAWEFACSVFDAIWSPESRETFWKTFNETLNGLLGMAIDNLDINTLWSTFKTKMHEKMGEIATVSVGNFRGSIVKAFQEFRINTLPETVQAIIKAARLLFGIGKSKSEFDKIGEESGEGFGQGLKNWFKAFGLTILEQTFIGGVVNTVMKLLDIGSPSKVFDSIGQYTMAGFLQGLTSKFRDITTFFTNMVSAFSKVGSGLVSALQSGFSSMWGTFTSHVSQLVSTLVSGISTAVQTGFSGLSTAIGSAVTTASGKLHELANSARSSISTLLENSKSSLNNIVSGIQGAVNNIISQANSILSRLRGRSYAMGGFPEDGLFMANHNELVGQFSNGKTAVANNKQITEGIKQAVIEGMQTVFSSEGGEATQPYNIYLGDELVYSGYTKYSKRQQLISGGRA